MSFNNISKKRSEIMFISMVMIMIFHTDIKYSHVLDLIKNFGDFGVNLFFAISGFSMCFAWKKNPDALKFIKSRLIRIGITVLPVSIVWCLFSFLINECTLIEAICKILTIQFWIDGNLLQWFVSAIIVFYLVTPLWMKAYNKNAKLTIFLSLIVSLLALFLPRISTYAANHVCFVQRVPAYTLGLYLGKRQIEEKDATSTDKILVILLLVVGIVGFALIDFNTMNYSWKYILYAILTYPVLMLLSSIKGNKTRIIDIGSAITLEVYIFQEKILKIVNVINGKKAILNFDENRIVINLIVIVATLIIAIVYHNITDKLYKKIK